MWKHENSLLDYVASNTIKLINYIHFSISKSFGVHLYFLRLISTQRLLLAANQR